MAEFSKLNGYDVKDKKAIRTYNNVALMKADTTLKEGQCVKTLGYYNVNDGGQAEYHITTTESETEHQEVLNNNLFAELIYDNKNINLMQFGIEENDDASELINNLISNYNILIINDNVTIQNTININNHYTNFKILGTLNYTGSGYAINITSSRNNIEINHLISNAYGIEFNSDNRAIYFNDIKINTFESEKNNFYIHGNLPIVHNKISGLSFITNTDNNVNVYIPDNVQNSYITELLFYDVNFQNTNANYYGVSAICNNSNSEINYNLNYGDLESSKGIYSKGYVTYVTLNNVRITEFTNKTLLDINDYLGNYYILCDTYARNNWFKFTNVNTIAGKIHCSFGYRDSITTYYFDGETIVSPNRVKVSSDTIVGKAVNTDTTIDNVFTQGIFNSFSVDVSSSTINLILDQNIYNVDGISYIYLTVSGSGTNTCCLKDANSGYVKYFPQGRYKIYFNNYVSSRLTVLGYENLSI